jgi:hypothetical protein
MNDALMIGVVLTLVFGSVIFYLYNRLTMTEKKLNLFGGIITDLKIMMDSVPFSSAPPPANMQDFEPSPEYLNTISGPIPLQSDEIDDVASEEDEYQQTLEQALESATAIESVESKVLHIAENGGDTSLLSPAINVTKLSPDLEGMTVKELNGLAKQKGLTVPAGTRRKELIEMLKKATAAPESSSSMLDGPVPLNDGAPLDGSLPESLNVN